MKKKVYELAYPWTTSMCPPPVMYEGDKKHKKRGLDWVSINKFFFNPTQQTVNKKQK